ncbi:MAG TPA: DUF167 family protein [Gemmatimonadales bacterium]|nr:DUF167 family protein [Gemmatimonadales bacterium]
MAAIERTPDGVRLRIRVQPRASRTEVAGLHGDTLRVRLSAPPVDGAANEALLRFLAERLSVRRSAVQLISGATGRSKLVSVAGIDLEQARLRLRLPTLP